MAALLEALTIGFDTLSLTVDASESRRALTPPYRAAMLKWNFLRAFRALPRSLIKLSRKGSFSPHTVQDC